MDIYEQALELHARHKGKITTKLRDDAVDRDKLSMYYSPGVAEVSRAIAKDPLKLRDYTWTNNLVAVISDGSAVLGLGNIGGRASMPVMEGKAMLFKHFADIDSVPIILDTQDTIEIISTIKAIAHSFGAINLEDIAAPKCFEIEERLKKELDIPVFHDDQHGTAIVVLAGLINAMKVVDKKLKDCKIVMMGAGAAGVAIAKLLKQYAGPTIVALDSKGVLESGRSDLNETKQLLAGYASSGAKGQLSDVIEDADVFIGVSAANVLSEEDVRRMANGPIIFVLANPDPEIKPELAMKAGAAIVATGRGDYPNQVNNALAFPGIFRGALDHRVSEITEAHKIAAAEVIASLVENPAADDIVPSFTNEKLVPAVASVIK